MAFSQEKACRNRKLVERTAFLPVCRESSKENDEIGDPDDTNFVIGMVDTARGRGQFPVRETPLPMG